LRELYNRKQINRFARISSLSACAWRARQNAHVLPVANGGSWYASPGRKLTDHHGVFVFQINA
jgi:hypothetical protein